MATLGKPLDGIKIIELSTMITASLSSMILASQGADVIKIEPPGIGDLLRHIGTQKKGVSGVFANCNRGKRSVALDLKTPEGLEAVRALAQTADILVHNFRPGVMDRLGLGAKALQAVNPRLIHVSISGFGSTGPSAGEPAYDPVIQAQSGFMSVQGSPQKPEFVRALFSDKITAYTAAQAMSAALYGRERTGKGQALELSMLESITFFNWPDTMANHTLLADGVTQQIPIHKVLITVEASDGTIVPSAASDTHWAGLCAALDSPELQTDPRFDSLPKRSANWESLCEAIEGRGRHKSTAELMHILQDHDVPVAVCSDLDGLLEHPQLTARGVIAQTDHTHLGPVRTLAPPALFDGARGHFTHEAPMLGEHTEEVLAEIGS